MSAASFSVGTVPSAFTSIDSPTFESPFEPLEWEIANTGGTDVEYSFDGVNVAGVVRTGLEPARVNIRGRKVWVRDNAGTGSARVSSRSL